MKTLDDLLKRNKEWAEKISDSDPGFFASLSKQQKPEYLWIGCSDSRVPATKIVGMMPGDIFVHRNIANLVVNDDLNGLSVIQYAVEALRVKHIIVCGHYGCGGIKAAMGSETHGRMDDWLAHIKEISLSHAEKLNKLDDNKKFALLCELNVAEQVNNVCDLTIIKKAWANGADLSVHGLIYDLANGCLKQLGTCASSGGRLTVA